MTLNDTHRAFLQQMLQRTAIPESLVQRLYVLLHEQLLGKRDMDSSAYPEWISEMNGALQGLGLELASVICPVRNERTWALINNQPDQIAQLSNAYPNSVDYIKQLIEAIVRAPKRSFSISITDAMNLVEGKKKDIEELLFLLQRQSWLIQPERGLLTLAPKLLLELKGYLLDTYPDDIAECSLCHGLVTIGGTSCSNPECTCKLHSYCQDKYFAVSQTSRSCPLCKGAWALSK